MYTIADSAQATCEQLIAHSDRLWAFVDHDQVEPTNNTADCALRQAVIWRKLSFGTQSDAGSRFVSVVVRPLDAAPRAYSHI